MTMTDDNDYIEQAQNEVEKIIAKGPLLEQIRDYLRELRQLLLEKESLEERVDTVKHRIKEICEDKLITLYSAAHITNLDLEAEGNLQAYNAQRKPFYAASIPKDKELQAFAWLQNNGHADIVKTTITVALGMKERVTAIKVENYLDKNGIDYSSKLAVHASTLKAFVKNEIKAGHVIPRDLLGVYVGETVEVTPINEK